MNILWFGVLRPLYALGLLLAMPLFFVVALSGVSRQADVAIPVLGACIAYFALGLVVFGFIPRYLKSRLMERVATGLPQGFVPSFEATSVLHNRYLGIDSTHRQAYLVDTDHGTRTVVGFDAVAAWQVVTEPRQAPMLTLTTRLPRQPSFGLRLRRKESARVAAELAALLPTH